MGLSPRDVGSMWLWEFMACVDEQIAMSGKSTMSADEAEDIGQMLDAAPDRIV